MLLNKILKETIKLKKWCYTKNFSFKRLHVNDQQTKWVNNVGFFADDLV